MPPLNRVQKSGIALAVSQLLSHGAQAATITVNNLGDANQGCTLRQALDRVNTNGETQNGCSSTASAFGTNDTITFANPGTIVLGSEGQLDITEDVSINASTVSGVTIDANQNSRVMEAGSGSTSVTLSNLTLTGGRSGEGAGIYAGGRGELTMVDCTITGNEASSRGGGLFVQGYGASVNIVNSEFSNNIARDGGAIYLYNYGGNTLTLSNSTIDNNLAVTQGGGIYSRSSADVINLTNSMVINNTAGEQGGGIFLGNRANNIDAGTLALSNTTVSANSSSENGGGVYGGRNSTITLLNSTVSGNSTTQNGGGIYANSGSLTLTNSTVSDNTAGQNGGGLLIAEGATTLTLNNSILADSVGGVDCAVTGSVIADAQSIVEDGTCGSRAGDPGLLPLANNGGPTLTHALASNSIAINTGDNASCLATDQRGESRSDGKCDVGAFEVQNDSGFLVIPLPSGKVIVLPE